MVSREMPENREEKGTNPDSGVVLSGMDNPADFWPERCGADYVANLAPAKNWDVAVTACQMRAGYDIGETGRAVLADMALRASRIGADGDVIGSEGD